MASGRKRIVFFGIFAACAALCVCLTALKASVLLLSREYQVPPTPLADALRVGQASPERLAFGHHLVHDVLGCVQCHGPALQGQLLVDEPTFGTLASPNLTAGRRSRDRLRRAVRYGLDSHGRGLWLMPSEAYGHLCDDELGAVVDYLSSDQVARAGTEPAAKGPDKQISAIGRMRLAAGFVSLFDPREAFAAPSVPAPQRTATSAYGAHLARVAQCISCHQPGGAIHFDVTQPSFNPAQLRLTGKRAGPLQDLVRNWSAPEFDSVMLTGQRADGQSLLVRFPWHVYPHLDELELTALWNFVHPMGP